MSRDTSTSGHASNHHLESSTHVSSAKATMQQYAPTAEFPPNPAIQTNYATAPGAAVSDFAPDFRGCLGCGGSEHVFRSCPMQHDPATIERFHRNFNIKFNRPEHNGSTRCRKPAASYGSPYSNPDRRFHQPPPGRPPAFSHHSTPGAGRGAHRNDTAWMTHQHNYRTNADPDVVPDSSPSPPKKPRNYTLFVRSCQQQVSSSPALRPMPIRVDNGLPHLCLNLGFDADAMLSVLFDSGAALSSGYLPYQIFGSCVRIQTSSPVSSVSMIQIHSNLLSLVVPFRHPDDYNESLHGQLTAIIRCHAPYVDHDGARFASPSALVTTCLLMQFLACRSSRNLACCSQISAQLSSLATTLPPPSTSVTTRPVVGSTPTPPLLLPTCLWRTCAPAFLLLPFPTTNPLLPRLLTIASLPLTIAAKVSYKATSTLFNNYRSPQQPLPHHPMQLLRHQSKRIKQTNSPTNPDPPNRLSPLLPQTVLKPLITTSLVPRPATSRVLYQAIFRVPSFYGQVPGYYAQRPKCCTKYCPCHRLRAFDASF